MMDPLLEELIGLPGTEDWRAMLHPQPVFSDGPLSFERVGVPDPFDAFREAAILKAHGVSTAPVFKTTVEEDLHKRSLHDADIVRARLNALKVQLRRRKTGVDDVPAFLELHNLPAAALDDAEFKSLLAGVIP